METIIDSHILEDLVSNILLRLSVISCVRFRCVSKIWYSLLSDPIFMYKNIINFDDDNDDDVQLLIKRRDSITDHNYFSLSSYENYLYCNNISPSKRYLPLIEGIPYSKSITIVGCCNGLVCITDNRNTILVWNPSTKETKILPQSSNYTDFDFALSPYFEVGFCFDANANDYKVIRIFHTEFGGGDKVELYSFKSDSWRKIAFPCGIYLRRHGTPINSDGKSYHWLATTPDTRDRMVHFVVLSFDVNLELFETTTTLYFFNDRTHPTMRQWDNVTFFMLKDSVGICARSPDEAVERVNEISILLKIGVKESWIKLTSIICVPLNLEVGKILGCLKDGKLFVQTCKEEMFILDPFTQEIVRLPSYGILSRDVQIMTYKRTTSSHV